MQRIIILRMTCWPIQPNLWAGPDPRDDEDFRNLQSQNITAVLSLQDEQDRGDGGSSRSGRRRLGWGSRSKAFRSRTSAMRTSNYVFPSASPRWRICWVSGTLCTFIALPVSAVRPV